MYIECHNAQIIKQWTTDDGLKSNAFVTVEFTLHDSTAEVRHLRSQFVECVSIRTDRKLTETRKKRRIIHRAIDQVSRYFNGDGGRENIFVDGADSPRTSWLSPRHEAELQAELRKIEREFAPAI